MIEPRVVELVLVDRSGNAVGRLPPVPVATPWWPEAWPIVDAVRTTYELDVVILRLLAAKGEPPGGEVTYVAEVAAPAELGGTILPFDAEDARALGDQSLRMPWARPGGPAADLDWARARLAELGLRLTGDPVQIRTWNLSSLWRLPVAEGAVWFKHVPPFFAHESAVLRVLARPGLPVLLAGDGARSLIREIPGDDMYDAGGDVLERGVALLVAIQLECIARVDELVALGLPDWRARALTDRISDVIDRAGGGFSAADRATLDAFRDGLPERFDAIAACGIADTLVHGDFSPGNLRGEAESLVLLDWGDSGVGHPLLDQPAMLERGPADAADALLERWTTEWRRAIPGSDPERAAALLAPVAAARQATIYQGFLDRIEPSERAYHHTDPARWLNRTVEILREESSAAPET